jgi:hypothetical protein
MMLSNIFLVLPVVFAGLYHQWIYFFLASGLLVFSPLFHWFRIKNVQSMNFILFKVIDWLFGIGAFVYMYLYSFQKMSASFAVLFSILLTITLIFFFYGWRYGEYEKWHPWFHFFAPVISSAILIVAH